MNEQEKNTEDTSTPNPESQVETTTTNVSEDVAEKTEENTSAVTAAPAEETTPVVSEPVPVPEASVEEVNVVKDASEKATPIAVATAYATKAKHWVLSRKYTISAVVLVIVALVGLLYIMEEQGRINTGIFDKVQSAFSGHQAVAKVNSGKITNKELETSISQIAAGAAAQGMDTTDPELVAQIRSQAIDMLINTELLMQEAEVRGVTVTDADVSERINTLTEEVGGEDVLAERMAQFGIDTKTLRNDVRNELTIQALLEEVFKEQQADISDDEVQEFYDAAGGEAAGLPALEEVAEQIKEQIRSTREQEQVTTLIEELRGKATIEILI